VGIKLGDLVEASGELPEVQVGTELLGRILDGLGTPIDDKGALSLNETRSLRANPINPMNRQTIDTILSTGVRAIDGLLTCGVGQRFGIFAGSGVGKSTLLGMIARNSKADVNVISLVGERGREVSAFIENDLGPEGVKRSVVVVSTSDNPPLIRMRAAFTATAIAEYFRDQGKNVLLMMDSVTRFAMAQREVGLSAGEPPSAKGYTPSVFSLLPQLLERAGNFHTGSITGIYTVLVEGDDMNEPISDAVRSILDGHIVLSRKLASKNHYPSIDVLSSVSRLMSHLVSMEQSHLAGKIRD
jgi:flagellum-specific ATP synthase